jgi:biopolymer transport protein ExbD
MRALTFILLALPVLLAFESCKEKKTKGNNTLAILVLGDKIAYRDEIEKDAARYKEAEFDLEAMKKLLAATRREYGHSFHVVLKFSNLLVTVDDMQKIFEIVAKYDPSYALEKLTSAEKEQFNTMDFDGYHPPEPVAIATPEEVQHLAKTDSAFVIFLKRDHSIWYQPGGSDRLISVDKKNSQALINAIAAYKLNHARSAFYIQGTPNATYQEFAVAVEALKANNELKYQLITTQDE